MLETLFLLLVVCLALLVLITFIGQNKEKRKIQEDYLSKDIEVKNKILEELKKINK